jgi:hypothetical protein
MLAYARAELYLSGASVVAATLPFGKHRGRDLRDVPLSYLRWAIGTCDLDPWTRQHVQAELQRRGTRFLPAAAVLADLEELIAEAVDADARITHAAAGLLTDCVLVAFEQLRAKHGIGQETELVINPAQRPAWGERAAC